MASQVIFKIGKELKDKAMQKAKNEGVALACVLKLATKAFAADQLNIALIKKEEFHTKTRSSANAAIKDIKSDKNLSSKFKTKTEIKKYLEG